MPKRRVSVTLVLAAAFLATGPSRAPGAPAGEKDGGEARWAWNPVARAAVPTVADSGWAKNPIDAFIFSKLQSANLRPSAPADKRALVRRAYFDLLGIPPTPEAVEAFAADQSPDAYEKLVDGLLASPHFGERWARHWMDLVRYAEGHGLLVAGTAPPDEDPQVVAVRTLIFLSAIPLSLLTPWAPLIWLLNTRVSLIARPLRRLRRG